MRLSELRTKGTEVGHGEAGLQEHYGRARGFKADAAL